MEPRQTETLEEIAERIASDFYDVSTVEPELFRDFQGAILTALRNERERAAKMVLERRWMFDHELAKAIREGK